MPTSLTSLTTASIAPAAVALLGATAVKATLILVMAAALALVLRHSAAATRHLVWTTALAGVLLLPALDVALPGWYVSLPGAATMRALGDRLTPRTAAQQVAFKVSTSPASAYETTERHADRGAAGATENPLGSTAANTRAESDAATSTGAVDATIHDVTLTHPSPAPSPATILLELWLAGVVVALLPLCLGAWQLARIARRARDVESDVLDDFAARLARTLGVKRVVRRTRPDHPSVEVRVGTPSRLSFPSAHATSTTAAAVLYGRLLRRPLVPVLVPPMALSRLVLGVHYPSDVVAGSALGAVVALAVRRATRRRPTSEVHR